MTTFFHNFSAFSTPDKGRLFVMDAIKLAPKGLVTWYLERDQSPGMVNIRENRIYAHEVAAKLIEEKRQELKNGTSQKDLLSLLSSSCIPFTRHSMRCDVHFFSQGKLHYAIGSATNRGGNRCPSSVR